MTGYSAIGPVSQTGLMCGLTWNALVTDYKLLLYPYMSNFLNILHITFYIYVVLKPYTSLQLHRRSFGI